MKHVMYDRNQVGWMEKELVDIGIEALVSETQVDNFLNDKKGCALILFNSVCGCAAGNARPGVGLALQNKLIPDRCATVFAGVSVEAVAKARNYITEVPSSSPSIALLKDGELVFFLPRSEIEGFSYEEVAQKLTNAFDEHCTKEGPMVSLEQLHTAFSHDDKIPR